MLAWPVSTRIAKHSGRFWIVSVFLKFQREGIKYDELPDEDMAQ